MPTKTKEEVQAFTAMLDRKTYRRLKLQSVDERRPMSEIIRDSVRNYLDLAQAKGR